MIKLIDRYLLKNFWFSFLIVFVICYMVLLVSELFGNMGDMLQNETPLPIIIQFFWFVLPFKMLKVMPIVIMLAVLFSFGFLARNLEILAMNSSGMSIYRVSAPIIASALFIALTMIVLNETIIYDYQQKAEEYERFWIEGDEPVVNYKNVFRKGEGMRFFVVDSYNKEYQQMTKAAIISLNPESWRVSGVEFTNLASFQDYDKEKDKDIWLFEGAFNRKFEDSGRQSGFTFLTDPEDEMDYTEVALEPGLNELLKIVKEPEQMNARDLSQFILNMERIGEPTAKFRVGLWLRVLFPFACIVMILNGLPYALRAQSGRNMLAGFGWGFVCILAFYATTGFMLSLGERGTVLPWMATALPIVAFSIFGLYQMKKCSFSK